jgi:DNA-binding beta-propeller fold protein YncE
MKNYISICFLLLGLFLIFASNSNAETHKSSYHELKRISLQGGDGWDFLTFDAESRLLYVTRATHVAIVNIDSGKVVGDIANTPGVHGVALAPALKRGFATNGKEGTVLVFNTDFFKEEKRIPVGTKPDAILFEPISQAVWVFNGGSNDVTVIDAKSLEVRKTLALPGKPEVPVADNKGTVFINIEDKSEIAAIDAQKLSIQGIWSLASCEKPSGLSIDESSRRLFAVCDNKIMTVVNADSGKVITTIPIGNGPDGSAFDIKNKLVFSPNGKDGTLTIIREVTPDKFEAIDTVPTEQGARTIAIDTKTGNIILATAKDISPSPDARPKIYELGSFGVLVFGR